MARELDRNWNKGRVNIWNKETRRSTLSNPSHPPPLPPPPTRSRPSNIRQQPRHLITCDEALRRVWQRGSSQTNSRDRMWDRNPSRDDGDSRLPERISGLSPVNRGDEDDTVKYGRPAWQQVVIAAPVQVKRKDKLKTPARGRDDGQERLPPPAPPRLDIPIDGRIYKSEYRRLDEYDEEPRLRAELYPLEDEPTRKGGGYRQTPETIEILPERNILLQKPSEFNVVYPRKSEDFRTKGYGDKTHVNTGNDDYGYLDRRDTFRKYQGNNDNFVESRTDFHDSTLQYGRVSNREIPNMGNTSSNENFREQREIRENGRRMTTGGRNFVEDRTGDRRSGTLVDEFRDRTVDDYRRRSGRNTLDDELENAVDRRSVPVGVSVGQPERNTVTRRSVPETRGDHERRNEQLDNSYGARRTTFERKPSHHEYYDWDGGRRSNLQNPSPRNPTANTSDFLRKRSGGDVNKENVTGKKSPPHYAVLREEHDDIPVEKRDSIQLPVLEEGEKEFHELVASGDVSAVRRFLRDHHGFNINCVNYQKISALHVAVHEQNEAMVEFLLEQRSLDCSDCALYAIKEGNVRIVEKIMDKIRETSPGLEYVPTSHSVDFPDDMTPIILAAQLGNYEIIDFLIKRDHIIPPVHNPYCKCEACKEDLKKYDRLKYSTMKLNLYKAICNPMYIFHVTDDPFQRAFDLTQELMDAAKVFPQFKISYEELWKELRNFTVDLIGCCRNAEEVEIILKKSANNIAGSITFPRLQYAIDLKQKEFVSHPYTQAVLVDAWTGDLLEWKVRSPLMQALSIFPRIPMLPVMAVMCMFLPNHKLVKKWKTPVNKMISSVASYLIFLLILFLESNLDKSNQKRGPPNSGLEGFIIIYVIGYIWLNIRLCFRLGPKRFFSTMWHWFDCIMLFLFTMTIIFWIASLADVTANNEVDLPRKYWNALDPELIAEGFFAAAVIMAFFRLNMFLSLNYHLGPLQVSIGKMTLDIFRFIIIFFIIILAWCAGLCRFYQPYDGMVQKDAVSGSSTTQVSSFVNFAMTLKTFFWAIFGMSPIESADVVIENLPGDTPESTIINHHEFTEAVGYIAFALFQFLSVVVVLNMLVACMANTFTKVIDNVTVEWVFGRSQIYLSFMAASTLPPPFNLLPTASGIKSTFLWLKLLAKSSHGQRAKCNITHCCYIESEMEEYVNTEFPSLMSELAQRYLRLKGETAETHDELEELKTEMREILRKVDDIIISLRKHP